MISPRMRLIHQTDSHGLWLLCMRRSICNCNPTPTKRTVEHFNLKLSVVTAAVYVCVRAMAHRFGENPPKTQHNVATDDNGDEAILCYRNYCHLTSSGGHSSCDCIATISLGCFPTTIAEIASRCRPFNYAIGMTAIKPLKGHQIP